MQTPYYLMEEELVRSLGGTLSFDANAPVSLFATTSFLYTAAIMTIVVVAAGRYMLAGVWRIEASERGVRKSNEEIRRVTLGLLGVLSLSVILYTFNKGLLRGDVGLDGLRSAPAKAVQTPASAPTPSAPITTNGTEQANRDALAAIGIKVNKPACTQTQVQQTPKSGPPPDCTNLADMSPSVMTMLTQLKDTCPGSTITITGGTEPGHKTHGPGKAAVDIRIADQTLDSCIQKYPKGPYNSSNSERFRASYLLLGFIFGDEVGGERHWHVSR